MKRRYIFIAVLLVAIIPAVNLLRNSEIPEKDSESVLGNSEIPEKDSASVLGYWDIRSEEQLNAYLQKIADLNQELINGADSIAPFPAAITFSRCLSFEEMEAVTTRHGIDPQQLQLWAVKQDGTRVMITSRTTKGFEETEKITQSQAKAQNAELLGITGIYFYVSPEQISSLLQDKDIYLVDTSSIEAVLRGLIQQDEVELNYPDPIMGQLVDYSPEFEEFR